MNAGERQPYLRSPAALRHGRPNVASGGRTRHAGQSIRMSHPVGRARRHSLARRAHERNGDRTQFGPVKVWCAFRRCPATRLPGQRTGCAAPSMARDSGGRSAWRHPHSRQHRRDRIRPADVLGIEWCLRLRPSLSRRRQRGRRGTGGLAGVCGAKHRIRLRPKPSGSTTGASPQPPPNACFACFRGTRRCARDTLRVRRCRPARQPELPLLSDKLTCIAASRGLRRLRPLGGECFGSALRRWPGARDDRVRPRRHEPACPAAQTPCVSMPMRRRRTEP